MQGELRMFTRTRQPIGVVHPATDVNASWVRNGIGALTFRIPKRSLRWSTVYMRMLNRIEYHHPQLPIVWVGYVMAHSVSGADVKIGCVSAEWLYFKRYTEHEPMPLSRSSAEIALILHSLADRIEPLGIIPGDCSSGADSTPVTMDLTNCGDGLKSLASLSNADWWVEKLGHRHADPWFLRWSVQRGRQRQAFVLLCSEIVDDPQYQANANDMATAVHVLGKEAGGLREYIYRRNRPATQVYGVLEAVVDRGDVYDLPTLEAIARLESYMRSHPGRGIGLNIDNRRGVWGTFWLADTVRTIIAGVDFAGLDTNVRVDAIQIDDSAQKMGLVVAVLD